MGYIFLLFTYPAGMNATVGQHAVFGPFYTVWFHGELGTGNCAITLPVPNSRILTSRGLLNAIVLPLLE